MRTIKLESWQDFSNEIMSIREEFGERVIDGPEDESISLPNDILFRGQANDAWGLETTLERATTDSYTVQRYLQRADSCVNEIESVTGREWRLQPYPDKKRDKEMPRLHARSCATLRLSSLFATAWIPLSVIRLVYISVHRSLLCI